MKKQFVFGWMLALAAALVSISTPAFATVQTIDLGKVFAGSTPDGTAPWLTATFTYTPGSSTGTLLLQANLGAEDFIGGVGNSANAKPNAGWAFYLDPSLTLSSLTCETANHLSTNCATKALFGGNYKTGPVSGPFNMLFAWAPANRFDQSEYATYTLTLSGTETFSSDPFVVNGSDGTGWLSKAHVQGIGPNQSCSGWIVNGSVSAGMPNGTSCSNAPPPTSVPEPGALGIFGLGVLLIGGFLGWRRRRF